MTVLNEDDFLVEIDGDNYIASYKSTFAIGKSHEDAINRLKRELQGVNKQGITKEDNDDFNEDEVRIDKSGSEYKAYYKGEFAAGKTYEEALERVKRFYRENSNKKESIKNQIKSEEIGYYNQVSKDLKHLKKIVYGIVCLVGIYFYPIITIIVMAFLIIVKIITYLYKRS